MVKGNKGIALRSIFISILITILIVSPLVLAQEQTQTYSGFNRFTDNVKLFFSSGDNKVNLALEIREKEINSVLENMEDDKETTKSLERARNKLLLVQEKLSANNAEKVKVNVNEIIDKVKDYENLSEEFKNYILEEEKTQLTAKLVVEVDGKEGQTMIREVVKNETTGQNTIKIVVIGENGEEIITETQGQIMQIQNQIAERVIKITMAGQINKEELENGVYVAKSGNEGSEGLNPEVKTDIKEGTIKNDPLPEPDLNKINPDLYDPNARAPGDTIDETYDDTLIKGGDCGDGVDCGDGSADPGLKGTNDIAPAVDSNEGDLN
jgi:hypothetical protein